MELHALKKLLERSLASFDFRSMFLELGWDKHDGMALPACQLADTSYSFTSIVHKRGVQVFTCTASDGVIPPHDARLRIQRHLRKYAHENLLIFCDAAKSQQVWLWVEKLEGSNRPRTYAFNVKQIDKPLIEALSRIRFTLDEERSQTLDGVLVRLQSALGREKVTRKFYQLFESEHKEFAKFINGIPDKDLQRWYVSVVLNRLMFVYFIQEKGLLGDGDTGYLRNKLEHSKRELGKDSYYRKFLSPLFFEGFALKEQERSKAANELLGQVPYLNGGIFQQHEIEKIHGKSIQIPDQAFEQLFTFFEKYRWHLDERQNAEQGQAKGKEEINPDVLGYIFEKYINNKEMGAYYTKEDITGYISQNTILPFFLERLSEKVAVAFQPQGAAWKLLADNPDRYIYEAVRRGVVIPPLELQGESIEQLAVREAWIKTPDSTGVVLPESELPEFVREGMADPRKRMYDKRYNLGLAWSGEASRALPTETWREYIERRKRCLELREKLAAGEVTAVNDLITHNLNIRQFAADVLAEAGEGELIKAAWEVLHGSTGEAGSAESQPLSVLDPTVGSGAFLFAALHVLEPLYQLCLDRMQSLLAERQGAGTGNALSPTLRYFEHMLEAVSKHPNRAYFVLKSIMVNNLYGVDIMEEACEICKLRLFLKLVAQIDTAKEVEPLPDIDFNIRAGNTLVGFATAEEAKRAIESKLAFEDHWAPIEEQARVVERDFREFQRIQQIVDYPAKDAAAVKTRLLQEKRTLALELDTYLAQEYGLPQEKATGEFKGSSFIDWKKSHKPFHWWAEFYSIMRCGGFDAVIGNPPYVEVPSKSVRYRFIGYDTLPCGDLYALVMERSKTLQHKNSSFGMIVPVSLPSTDGFATLRKVLINPLTQIWSSNFGVRPAKLFNGADKRLTIWLQKKGSGLLSTRYHRWMAEEREALVALLQFLPVGNTPALVSSAIPKISLPLEEAILTKLLGKRRMYQAYATSNHVVYYTRKLQYFIQFLDFVPELHDENQKQMTPSELKTLEFKSAEDRSSALCTLNSSLFFWYFCVFSDVRNVNKREIDNMVLPGEGEALRAAELAAGLMDNYKKHAITLVNNYKSGKRTIQSFQPRDAKHLIDEIDNSLATILGLSSEQLDFVVNYDIKYRLGRDSVNESAD